MQKRQIKERVYWMGAVDLLAVLQKCLKKGRLKMLFEEWG